MPNFTIANKIEIANPHANVDVLYGPYNSLAEAKATVLSVLREKGLTVGVYESGAVVEYWWKAGTADGDLVLKQASVEGVMLESEYTGETGTKQVNYAKYADEAEQAIHAYSAQQDALGREIHTTYALKQSGVTPPETARVILDNTNPQYIISEITAENLIVENNATTSGEIIAPVLAADKTLKISIIGNDTLIDGTSYADGVTIFAIYEASTETWTFTSILDPEVPDYSDITVDVMLENPTVLTSIRNGILVARFINVNRTVFIRTHTNAIGIYQCMAVYGGNAYLQLIAAGTALHTVRVKDGDVWYSQYDGKNAGSLVFDNTKKRVDALFAGSINAAVVDVSTWKSGEERPIGAMKDPTTGEPVFAPNIEVVDVYSISAAYKAALETESNWIVGGLPQPFWVTGWGLQGMRHQNNNYMYECIEDNKWIRYPLVAILDVYAVPGTEVTKLTTAGNWTGVNYTGTALVGCYKGMRHVSTTHVYEFYDDNLPCRTVRV